MSEWSATERGTVVTMGSWPDVHSVAPLPNPLCRQRVKHPVSWWALAAVHHHHVLFSTNLLMWKTIEDYCFELLHCISKTGSLLHFEITAKKVKYVDGHSTSSQTASNAPPLPGCQRWSPEASSPARLSANTVRPWIRASVSRNMPVYSRNFCRVLILPA